jgi:ATP-dependent exoDNAse (exonuclease V) beta subunit
LLWEALRDEKLSHSLSADGRARCAHLRSILEAAFRVRGESSAARWIERTWLALGGPACAASAQELKLAGAAFARLRELESSGMPDAADLPNSFNDLFADHGGASAVEIMTIHKAKGLEFDLVILPALDRAVPPEHGQLLLSHQFARAGRDGMVMAARPPVGADSDLLFEFLRCQRRDASVLEAQRLIYVACTRAKCQLRLTAVLDGNPGAPAGSLLRVLWPVVADEFESIRVPPNLNNSAPDAAPRGGPLRKMPLSWSANLAAGFDASETSAGVGGGETPVFDWAGETARRVGSLVHAELQTLDLTRLSEVSIRSREPHFRRWLQLHGVPAERLEQATQRVVAALLGVYGDPRGRWILKAGYRDDFREHAVSGYLKGELTRVVFDRTFIDESGVRWVIDYKTSQHLGGGLEEFLAEEVERYRLQLQRYAALARRLGPEPVRLALYFPLMSAWREWAAPPQEAVD